MNASATLPSPLQAKDYDAIIFDLGGVILNLDYTKTTDALGSLFEADGNRFYTRTAQNELFDQFERGELSAAAFRRHVAELFGRDASFDLDAHAPGIDAAWNALICDIPQETLELLKQLRSTHRTFLLSNTNEIHIDYFLDLYQRDYADKHGPFAELFEVAYYSHEMGQRKPEPRIYETLVRKHDLNPSRTLFLDDNLDNIAGAISVGLSAHHHPSNLPLTAHLHL